jgi:hypothetical protein
MNSLGSMRFMTQRSQSAQGMPKFGKAAQEGEVRLAPIDDVVVIIAARGRAAHHQEQHISPGAKPSNRSVSHPCSARVSSTSRTAVYGPVRTVVWSHSSSNLDCLDRVFRPCNSRGDNRRSGRYPA